MTESFVGRWNLIPGAMDAVVNLELMEDGTCKQTSSDFLSGQGDVVMTGTWEKIDEETITCVFTQRLQDHDSPAEIVDENGNVMLDTTQKVIEIKIEKEIDLGIAEKE
eukprot:TRINITY_DN476_c0_g2_i7.p1 TRINITY_DN476_c0_g2~~TRINITY_DN476_c0_g2_i7.p1  ORF type:complete len:108 (+),score=29.73 TRINITY_DN476_c0_g2_i7:238-561(+)